MRSNIALIFFWLLSSLLTLVSLKLLTHFLQTIHIDLPKISLFWKRNLKIAFAILAKAVTLDYNSGGINMKLISHEHDNHRMWAVNKSLLMG